VTAPPWGGPRTRPGGAFAQRSVRPSGVVVAGELVELGLQLGDGRRAGLLGEPAFQGLMEASSWPMTSSTNQARWSAGSQVDGRDDDRIAVLDPDAVAEFVVRQFILWRL
jgi:hypothetical protein